MAGKPGGLVGRNLDKAVAALQQGRRPAAEALFQTVLKARPDCVDALYLLGTMRAEEGQLDSAGSLLGRAARHAPDSPFIHNNLGNVELMRGQLGAAADHFRRALDLKPDLLEAAVNLGILLRRLGRSADAVDVLRSALIQRPVWPQARLNLAIALSDLGDHDTAIAELEAALADTPEFAPAHEKLGLELAAVGRDTEAIGHLARYLTLSGERAKDGEAALMLARLDQRDRPSRYPVDAMLRTYERKAEHWDTDVERAGMEFLGPRHVADYLARELSGITGLTVADLGCGTGLCGPLLRPLADRLEGVDLSPPMLAQARAKGCYDALACEDLPAFLTARPGQFDLLVASGVFILFGDLDALLHACHGALRPGGRLLFTAYRPQGEAPVEVRRNLHFAHSRDTLRDAGATAGFASTALGEVVHEYDHGVAQPGWLVAMRRAEA